MYPADISTLPSGVFDRLRLIEQWKAGALSQVQAASALKLSERHFRRLVRRFEAQGVSGLVDARKGKAPNNRILPSTRAQALDLIREHFYDYGPTLASEKLSEYFDIHMSKETIRQWMIQEQLYRPKQKKTQGLTRCAPDVPFLVS